MNDFDPTAYGPALAEVLQVDRSRSLGSGSPEMQFREVLERLTLDEAFAHVQVSDESMAQCCLSGAWLLCDFLDESHTISQSVSTTSGSYWHGIMHRREGDFSNAKYWFRKVGDHPLFEQLANASGQGRWDPFEFVDRCQRAVRQGENEDECRRLQQLEWELLFGYCYRSAIA